MNPCAHDPDEQVSDGEARWCGQCGRTLATWDDTNGWVDFTDRPKRQTGYDAALIVIRHFGRDAWMNAIIWQAVEAFANAYEPEVAARVIESVRRELDGPDPKGLVNVQDVRDALAVAAGQEGLK